MTEEFVPAKDPRRWLMLALVWLLYACFGLVSGSISPVVQPVIDDLGFTNTQMGFILGSWQLVYIGTASPLGALVDRLDVRRSLAIGIFIVLLSMVLRGFATNFFTMFLSVALFGIGGPIISIGAPKVVSLWFQGSERGTASGIYATGPAAGTAIALATAGSLIVPLTGSWRGISFVYGAVVLVIAIAWWLFARDVPKSALEDGSVAKPQNESAWKVTWELLHHRNVQLMLLLAPATFMLNHGLSSWNPTLLQERGMSLSQAGFWTAVATGFSVLSLLLIPRMARHGYRTWSLAILLIVSAGSSAAMGFLGGTPLVGSLLLSNFVRSPFMPLLTLILMETPGVGQRRIGAAAGIFFAAAEIGGFGGPFLMGLLRDATHSLMSGLIMLSVMTAALVLVLPFLQETRVRTKDTKPA